MLQQVFATLCPCISFCINIYSLLLPNLLLNLFLTFSVYGTHPHGFLLDVQILQCKIATSWPSCAQTTHVYQFHLSLPSQKFTGHMLIHALILYEFSYDFHHHFHKHIGYTWRLKAHYPLYVQDHVISNLDLFRLYVCNFDNSNWKGQNQLPLFSPICVINIQLLYFIMYVIFRSHFFPMLLIILLTAVLL